MYVRFAADACERCTMMNEKGEVHMQWVWGRIFLIFFNRQAPLTLKALMGYRVIEANKYFTEFHKYLSVTLALAHVESYFVHCTFHNLKLNVSHYNQLVDTDHLIWLYSVFTATLVTCFLVLESDWAICWNPPKAYCPSGQDKCQQQGKKQLDIN